MNDASSSYCKEKHSDCDEFGTYSPQDSDSFRPYNDIAFSTEYVDGTEISGVYAIDTINVAGRTVPNVPFAVAKKSTSALGVLGLGYSKQPGLTRVPTFSEVLLQNKIIKLNAYSLWLNDLTAESGSILYGGLDTAKIDGSLTTLPVRPPDVIPVGQVDLDVTLNAISFGGIRKQFLKVLLDSGNTGCDLPPDFSQSVLTSLNAENIDNRVYVDCSVTDLAKTLDFEFGSENDIFTTKIPLSQFVVHPDPSWNDVPKTSRGDPMCSLQLSTVQEDDDPITLGDTFLRSVYVVFDLTNNEISMGKVKYTSASNIIEIPEKGVTAMDLGQKVKPGDDNSIAFGDNNTPDLGIGDTSNAGNDETPIDTGNGLASNTENNDASNTKDSIAISSKNDLKFDTGNDDTFKTGSYEAFNPGNADTASEVSFLDPNPGQDQEGSEEAWSTYSRM